MTTTQTQRVLSTLRSGKTLTSAQARTRGILRLAARIHEIRESGVAVQTTFVNRNGSRTARYSL
jgi:hypothetical protein